MVGGITDSMDMSLSRLWEMVKDSKAWHAVVHKVTKSQTWLNESTTTNDRIIFHIENPNKVNLKIISTVIFNFMNQLVPWDA